MLVTVAILIIILGLMVSLARHVREESARQLTKDVLRRMDDAMSQYLKLDGNKIPEVPAFIPGPDVPPEHVLQQNALKNNHAVVQLLQTRRLLDGRFDDLSISYYDAAAVRDAWGSPIVFMPADHPAVGMAAKGWFFFSGGPDRRFLTRDDNLYSYEEPVGQP